ncbi:5-methyltetrahydropteroyltriglutamate--homocysteine methyltransferase [uncultured bacterium]|nr:5-methyltetrahydropteroyltriglutamate--homocysteine methyltransferase [uncultured bacterium]
MTEFVHYDTVGSFLRPKDLKEARKNYFDNHSISKDQYLAILHKDIDAVVKKQKDLGLKIVTDGEFSRTDFADSTISSFSGVDVPRNQHSIVPFHHQRRKLPALRLVGKIAFNPAESKDLRDFNYLKKVAKKYHITPRQSVSAPVNTFCFLFSQPANRKALKKYYPNFDDFIHDFCSAYHQLFLSLYKAGCRDIKIDDPAFTGLNDVHAWPFITGGLFGRDQAKRVFITLTNGALKDLPSDLRLSTHLCRGNNGSDWLYSGGYDYIADAVFAKENVGSFFLEYDDKRSGGFEPLKYVPKGKKVVLGLVTSKRPELEKPADLIKRIHEASKYVPLKDLALSPQCGFASTEQGNHLTEQQQWAKIKLVIDTAKKVWG